MAKAKKSFLQKLIGKEDEVEEQVDYETGTAEDMGQKIDIQGDQMPPQEGQEGQMPQGGQPPQQAGDNRSSNEWVADQEGQLTIDVYQTETDIVIKSTIAGVKPENLDVQINNDMVTIKGERKQEEEINEEDFYYQECYWGSFSRSIILPVDVQANKAEATMKNGILTIRLPKADSAQSRKIQVRGY
ncbi:MAG: Hsp20/alpha crystallin family protein [Patescibacteria group bacterium]|nr:Hsp20/alpha crystallin family protein [Patescibacteria group bacterium]